MEKSKHNYDKALKEIESIQNDLDAGKIKITDLHMKIKRAKELIEFCRNELKASEESLDHLFENETDK